METKLRSLCLVRANSQILLGYKKHGFGSGRWNGFGGKLEANETMLQAAARELTEESGVVGKTFQQRAVMRFHFTNGMELEVHLFEVTSYDGEPVETEEMRPQWFYENEIPFDKMWPDDHLWFPYFLEGKDFEADFYFKDENNLVDYKIVEIKK